MRGRAADVERPDGVVRADLLPGRGPGGGRDVGELEDLGDQRGVGAQRREGEPGEEEPLLGGGGEGHGEVLEVRERQLLGVVVQDYVCTATPEAR